MPVHDHASECNNDSPLWCTAVQPTSHISIFSSFAGWNLLASSWIPQQAAWTLPSCVAQLWLVPRIYHQVCRPQPIRMYVWMEPRFQRSRHRSVPPFWSHKLRFASQIWNQSWYRHQTTTFRKVRKVVGKAKQFLVQLLEPREPKNYWRCLLMPTQTVYS